MVATELVATELVATGGEAAEPEPEPGADPEGGEAEVECPCWKMSSRADFHFLSQHEMPAEGEVGSDPSRACLVF